MNHKLLQHTSQATISMFYLPLLNDELYFPPPEKAHESGLLAAGGDLSLHRLILAYSSGIFPWFDENDPFLWWSPDPRFVLETREFHLSKRQERSIRQAGFHITANTAFRDIIEHCACVPRKKRQEEDFPDEQGQDDILEKDTHTEDLPPESYTKDYTENYTEENLEDYPKGYSSEYPENHTDEYSEDSSEDDTHNSADGSVESGTWITQGMIEAYVELFEEGFAHSVEVWQKYSENMDCAVPPHSLCTKQIPPVYKIHNEQKYRLVGGLYGVRMGHVFCGESMFHLVPEASRAALKFLVEAMERHNMPLIDSQQETPHIMRMGGKHISRNTYLQIVESGLKTKGTAQNEPFLCE